MVDWEAVERFRSKGWDWDRIASDPKAEFSAEGRDGDSGRELRALYYQRRSKQARRTSGGPGGKAVKTDDEPSVSKWTLARAGWILAPLFAVWFVLAYVFPSPVGTYISAVPLIGLLLAISGAILAYGLLRSAQKWNSTFRTSLVVGLVLGLVIAGGFGLAAIAQGCPALSPSLASEPGNWKKASASTWTDNGAAVFFFYGSAACPFCSASSWAMQTALQRFGSLTGTYVDRSSPTDSYANTPEVVLANAAMQSRWVAIHIVEATDDNTIQYPSLGQCIEQAYVSSYDPGGIPFVVIGGVYVHSGTLVDPGQLQGLSADQIKGQISNQSGVAWNAVSSQSYLMMAFLVKLNGGQPANVASDPAVASALTQIT